MKCLLWGLIVLVHLHGLRGCFEEERMALLEIKGEFVLESFEDLLPSWVDDHKSECCEWERVTCNSTTGHVTNLSLHNIWKFDTEVDPHFYFKDIVWFLNVSLFKSFKELRSLDLSFNAIGGWIEPKGNVNIYPLYFLFSIMIVIYPMVISISANQ